MSQPIHITDAEFNERVLQAPLPVIVDFWAEWCSPCRAIAPALERIAVEYDGRLIVAKVDVDNTRSQRCFAGAGFVQQSTEPDEDRCLTFVYAMATDERGPEKGAESR